GAKLRGRHLDGVRGTLEDGEADDERVDRLRVGRSRGTDVECHGAASCPERPHAERRCSLRWACVRTPTRGTAMSRTLAVSFAALLLLGTAARGHAADCSGGGLRSVDVTPGKARLQATVTRAGLTPAAFVA